MSQLFAVLLLAAVIAVASAQYVYNTGLGYSGLGYSNLGYGYGAYPAVSTGYGYAAASPLTYGGLAYYKK